MVHTAKTFDIEDQVRFAALTGDSNPMHMDSISARRTQAGAPVVHGVHALLWLLDAVAAQHTEIAGLRSLKVRFRKMIYLREPVEPHIVRLSADQLRAKAVIDGVDVVEVIAAFGAPGPAPVMEQDARPLPRRTSPNELAPQDIEGNSGTVAFVAAPGDMQRAFPNAARWLGDRRLAALACSTYLVGMVVPGLHSMFVGLTLTFTEDEHPRDALRYAVASVDLRFRRVEMTIDGGGVSGTLSAAIRAAPVSQAPIERAADLLDRGEFAGSTSLVIGGSRGIGETTAKLIAAGGGKVIITYAAGKAEADRVAAEINHWGGDCDAVRYDIRDAAPKQLESLPLAPTHLYYFATPTILRRKSGPFSRARFEEFNTFFLQGFFNLVGAASALRPEGIVVFYPSSEFVVDRPADMTEYAMSKAAAEVLCEDMGNHLPGVRILVRRLPRLLTDQTAALDAEQVNDPLPVMLPVVREMHKRTEPK